MADVDDDDFGELYADVEARAISVVNSVRCFTQLYIENQQATNSTAIDDFAPRDPTPTTELASQLLVENEGSQRFKEGTEGVSELRDKVDKKQEEVEEENESDSEEDNESDSEDDFNILLNEDDRSPPGVFCDRGFQTGENGEESDGKENDAVGNGREHVAGNCFREKAGVVKGGDRSSLYNYVKSHGSGFRNNPKCHGNQKKDAGYIRENGTSLHGASVSYLIHNGYGFLRPQYRTILDMNIDAFEHKPWRNPGADTSDFFNYGFNEERWQGYCQSLFELRQQMSRVRTSPVNEDARLQQQQLNGRVIQVEDGNRERPSSMDVRRPRDQDSDVVIQITVQEGKEDSSGSDKKGNMGNAGILHEVSKSRCSSVDDRGEAQTPGSMDADNVSRCSAEEKVQSPCTSSEIKRHHVFATASSPTVLGSEGKRNEQLLDSDIDHHAVLNPASEEYRKAVKTQSFSLDDTEKSTEEMNPCLMKLDLSLDDHIHGCTTSPSAESKSEGSMYDDHCVHRGTGRAQRRSSSNSVEERDQLVESDYSFSRHHERDDIDLKSSSRYSSREKSPIEEEWKYRYRRRHLPDKLKNYNDDNDVAYCNPSEDYMRKKHQLRSGRHKRNKYMHDLAFSDEGLPFNGEAAYFHCYDDKRVGSNRIRADYPSDSHRRSHRSLRDDIDPYFRTALDKRDFISGRTNQHMMEEIGRIDWDRGEGELLHENLTPVRLQYSRFTKRGRINSWREYDDIHFERRVKFDSLLDSSYTDDLFLVRFGGPGPLHIDEMNYLDQHGQLSPRSGRDGRISGRMNRCGESKPSGFEYSRHGDNDDTYWITQKSLYSDPDTDRKHDIVQQTHDIYDSTLMERYGRHGRDAFTEGPGDGYCHGSNDAYDSCHPVRYHNEELYERSHNFHFDAFNWREGDLMPTEFDDKLYDEGISFDTVSRSKSYNERPRFLHRHMSNNRQVMKCGSKIMRGSDKLHGTNSKMLRKGKHEVSGLRCRDSVGLHSVVRERKSSGGSSKARASACGDLRESLQRRNQKQGRHPSNESHAKKVAKAEMSRDERFLKMQDDDGSDLEEGQIPTQNSSKKAMQKKRLSCSASDNGRLKRKHAQDENSDDIKKKDGTYNESWILETMAKMEKRRERFKEPVPQKKESDSHTIKSDVDKLVETAQENQQRPARRRRWGGS